MQDRIHAHAPGIHLPVDLQYWFVTVEALDQIVPRGITREKLADGLQAWTLGPVDLVSGSGPGVVFDRSFLTIGLPIFLFKIG